MDRLARRLPDDMAGSGTERTSEVGREGRSHGRGLRPARRRKEQIGPAVLSRPSFSCLAGPLDVLVLGRDEEHSSVGARPIFRHVLAERHCQLSTVTPRTSFSFECE